MILWIIGLLIAWVAVLTVEVVALRRDIGQLDGEIDRLNMECMRRRK
jgi:hypothetical protein